MANYEFHHLFGLNIKEALIEGGYVGPKTLTSKAHPKGVDFEFVLDYAKCSPDEWQKQLASVLERGVIDFGKKNTDGSNGVRRDYTPEEQSELGFYPVQFSEDGTEMTWICKWMSNDDPAFYASCALENATLILDKFYEATYDGGCYLKAGKNVAEKPVLSFEDFDGEIDILAETAYEELCNLGLQDVANEMQTRIMCANSNEEKFSILMTYVVDASWIKDEEEIPDCDPFEELYSNADADEGDEPEYPAPEPDPNVPF